MTTVRHRCVNLFEKEDSTLSLAKKRRKAAWNDDRPKAAGSQG